ncbi:hypothetical protein [Parasitella parasitica]|uniref:Histone deacetylase interacting domain-containing protein n=1 Tax=Parasitella parasitica TaxID=35722 RepID=A0A0B7NUF7_9FUNG|nr:hypothetical protein [Parasitella parasitica]
MTVPNQSSQTDPRRIAVPSSSLVGAIPYGRHNHLSSQQTQTTRHQYPSSYPSLPAPAQSASHHSYSNPANTVSAAGLVTAKSNNGNGNMGNTHMPLLSSSTLGSRSRPKYSDQPQHAAAETTISGTKKSNSEASPASPTDGGYRPLNVIDALAYLDQVKGRFADNPKVYNKFLDIMKDFKSQTIDTPGVIQRVSTLFKGHPQLISGFNTFLPTGYRIECSVDPRDPNRIIVTTPNGNTTTSTTSTSEDMMKMEPQSQQHLLHQDQYYPPSASSALASYLPPQPQQAAIPQPPSIHANNTSVLPHPFNTTNRHFISAAPPIHHHLPPPPPQSSSHSSTQYTSSSPTSPVPPITEKKPPVEFNHAINYVNRIKNRFAHNPNIYKQFLEVLQTYQKEQKPIGEVFEQVRYLFNGADDLLEEFKLFLPEITSSSTPSSSSQYQQLSPPLYDTNSTSHIGFKRVSSPVKQKKNHATKKAKLYQETYLQEEEDTVSYSLFDPQRPSVSAEEIDLFDRIKKYIGNKPSYEEFLKLLNLYTQEIVDMDTLVTQVKGFLGSNKELLDAFKCTIGYEPKEPAIEKPAVSAPKPDLNKCDAVKDSPSYRIVSKEWQHQPCSGRDQMCWEVLNDEFVSHPIWASEDSGFVASKKNQYEEALHRCEEERYEYDLNIEANLNTIALLKPIANRIEHMSPEEQKFMRLEPGLGGPTVSIYERIIRKIYDDERGSEIIDMLYRKPANVVPIVLKRLEIKDREWRRAQREWNKIWRDIDMKNFYRSLDYQGATFKMNDRKAMTNKGLIAEIEALQKEKPTELVQFQHEFQDDALFKDIARLVCSFMDKQTGFTKVDKQKVRKFLRLFVSMFFHVQGTLPAETYVEQDDVNEQEEDENKGDESDSTQNDSVSPGKRATSEDDHGKLLRGVFKRTASTPTILATAETDAASVEDEVVVPGDVSMGQADNHLDLFAVAAAATAPEIINQKRIYSFFCNSQYYCLFRLYLVIYERLHKMKSISNANDAGPGKKLNQTAVDLDLVPNRFEDIDLSQGFYQTLMDMIDNYFEGEIDQATFEENVRYVFGIDAYVIFTIDKTIQSLIKQIQNVSIDKKSNELFQLFTQDQQAADQSSARTLSAYRTMVEDILESDENLYKISFDTDTHTAHMQLLDRENGASLPSTEQEMYEDYLASYVDWMNDTEGINKNLRASSLQDKQLDRIHVKSQLRYKIQPKSYHMYYIIGSEDILHKSVAIDQDVDAGNRHKQNWNQWLSSQGNEDLNDATRRLFS